MRDRSLLHFLRPVVMGAALVVAVSVSHASAQEGMIRTGPPPEDFIKRSDEWMASQLRQMGIGLTYEEKMERLFNTYKQYLETNPSQADAVVEHARKEGFSQGALDALREGKSIDKNDMPDKDSVAKDLQDFIRNNPNMTTQDAKDLLQYAKDSKLPDAVIKGFEERVRDRLGAAPTGNDVAGPPKNQGSDKDTVPGNANASGDAAKERAWTDKDRQELANGGNTDLEDRWFREDVMGDLGRAVGIQPEEFGNPDDALAAMRESYEGFRNDGGTASFAAFVSNMIRDTGHASKDADEVRERQNNEATYRRRQEEREREAREDAAREERMAEQDKQFWKDQADFTKKMYEQGRAPGFNQDYTPGSRSFVSPSSGPCPPGQIYSAGQCW